MQFGKRRLWEEALTAPVPRSELSAEDLDIPTDVKRKPVGTVPPPDMSGHPAALAMIPAPLHLAVGTPKFTRPPTEDEELRVLIAPTPPPGVMTTSFLKDAPNLQDRLQPAR